MTGSRREALLQLRRISKIPVHAKRVLTSFLETAEDPDFNFGASQAEASLAVSAPEAESYGFQSGGIVEMLEKLLDKFRAELDGYQKEEMNSKFNSRRSTRSSRRSERASCRERV